MDDSENGRKLHMRKGEKGLDVRTGVTSSSENGRKLRIRKAEKGLDVRTRVTSSRVQETAQRGLNPSQGGGLEIPTGVDKIPYWIPVTFRPPTSMIVSDTEAEIAAYIFMSSAVLPGDEVLVKSCEDFGFGDRESLKTLMPTNYVDVEVMNLVVSMLNHHEEDLGGLSTCWYLPPIIAEFALGWETSPQSSILQFYKKKFMGCVELLNKIFVPMNDEDLHWYLLVVDLVQNKLILLDPCPSEDRTRWRRLHVRRVAVFIHEILMERSFYHLRTTETPNISEFPTIELQWQFQQNHSSNDCGIMVARWMIDCKFDNGYSRITVNDAFRMRLAIQLVLNRHNQIRDSVLFNAYMTWKEFEETKKSLFGDD